MNHRRKAFVGNGLSKIVSVVGGVGEDVVTDGVL
jgi:hypothetical protein